MPEMAATGPDGAPSSHDDFTWEQWLSAPRFATYLVAAGNDPAVAEELYWWNSAVAAQALIYVCHLEVAIRNAYDRELSSQFPRWTVDPQTQLFPRTQGMAKAKQRQEKLNEGSRQALEVARRGLGVSPTHGKVLANLSFGFWTKLTEPSRTPTFWTPMIHRAFAASPRLGEVHERVERVNRFRNRLAHNEPVFSTSSGLRDRLGDARQLFDWLSPEVSTLVHVKVPVQEAIDACPVPGLV